MNRRNFLQAGTLGLSAFGLPNIVESAEQQKKEKAVILIFLHGGISHQESFIASPDFPEKARSMTGYKDTKSGFKLGSHFEKLSSISHLFSPVYSFGHINPSHGAASHYTLTGYNINEELGQNHPSYGSIISRTYGAVNEKGVPHYTALNKLHAGDAYYLGNGYNPFYLNAEGKATLGLGIAKERFIQRMEVLKTLDNKFNNLRGVKDVDGYKRQGREILLGGVREIFEPENEPEAVRKMYGDYGFHENCMMARRLIENGVKFVTLEIGGWDFHENLINGYNDLAPKLDHGLATLLKDLSDRGLLDTTLVVVTSEFSRTLINATGGRDHWPSITSLVLAGGKYGGTVIGEINKDGMTAKSTPFTPIDLLKTIMNHMEIDNTTYTDQSGRPRYLLESDAKVII
jgi:hypothetical protein